MQLAEEDVLPAEAADVLLGFVRDKDSRVIDLYTNFQWVVYSSFLILHSSHYCCLYFTLSFISFPPCYFPFILICFLHFHLHFLFFLLYFLLPFFSFLIFLLFIYLSTPLFTLPSVFSRVFLVSYIFFIAVNLPCIISYQQLSHSSFPLLLSLSFSTISNYLTPLSLCFSPSLFLRKFLC